ncbi:hypothetical protein Busp01_10650 [Trinickia caryophylli]|nr:hypothetical protein Busp01_10650 [Trinickia caryophylli]
MLVRVEPAPDTTGSDKDDTDADTDTEQPHGCRHAHPRLIAARNGRRCIGAAIFVLRSAPPREAWRPMRLGRLMLAVSSEFSKYRQRPGTGKGRAWREGGGQTAGGEYAADAAAAGRIAGSSRVTVSSRRACGSTTARQMA